MHACIERGVTTFDTAEIYGGAEAKMGEAFAEASGMTKNPQDYFDSFESCYPLLSEVSYDMLVQAAEQLDIEVSGKDKMTLAKEIYAIKGVKGFE